MDKGMSNREQTLLVVSDDVALCVAARREFEAGIAPEAEGPRGIVPRLEAVVTSLAVYAPVVVIGTAEHRAELSALIDAGAADYVMRDGGCVPAALNLIRGRLRQTQSVADSAV